MKKSKILITFIIILLIAACILGIFFLVNNKKDNNNKKVGSVHKLSSEKELEEIIKGEQEENATLKEIILDILGGRLRYSYYDWPLDVSSIFHNNLSDYPNIIDRVYTDDSGAMGTTDFLDGIEESSSVSGSSLKTNNNSKSSSTSGELEYSKTNIQVENVDEADITKTDGKYIYSLSDNEVIITNVEKPESPFVVARINEEDTEFYPVDLLLNKDNTKLVVIYTSGSSSRYSYNYNKNNTYIEIYDVANKSNVRRISSFEIPQEYYTSRCINDQLYIVSSTDLNNYRDKYKEKLYYKVNGSEEKIDATDIYKLDDLNTRNLSTISSVNISDNRSEWKTSSYLMDVSNAYVSMDNIYLLDEKYINKDNEDYEKKQNIEKYKSIAQKILLGRFSELIEDDDYYYDNYYSKGYYGTKIYKFEINNGNVEYKTQAETKGNTLNQYSLDEKDGYLRIALTRDYTSSRIEVYDEDLNLVGQTEEIGRNEKMYTTRFMGDKCYMVTYKYVDPLFVIDLSNPRDPKVLGELKISGYSTYLHPYDENHLIGIGIETQTNSYRNDLGRVISTNTVKTSMKMALFDVTDVSNPKTISSVTIGDSKTTSAILENPKALLFSKEKELIAIPVNNYDSEIEIEDSEETDEIEESYRTYHGTRVSEGYLVYNINLDTGITLKGEVKHQYAENDENRRLYYYLGNSRLMRGAWINNNLFTISEDQIKVNSLNDLSDVGTVNVKDKTKDKKEE